ncbi:endonuclease domain-containing protein [Actinophytocola sediminis]
MRLDELPTYRRDYLLWRLTVRGPHTVEDVERFVRAQAGRPCVERTRLSLVEVARLGDDGRYHLWHEGKLQCSTTRTRGKPGVGRHRMSCTWWFDGKQQRRSTVSHPPDRELHRRTVDWTVELLDEQLCPADVAPLLRCPASTRTWPRYAGATTPVARLRARLITEFGPACFTCGWVADCVDHDHDDGTGYVRGWLCSTCNNRVDLCPHQVGECPYADYLAEPPARHLAMRYPNRGRRQRILSEPRNLGELRPAECRGE